MNYVQFAQVVKQKYPEYQNIPDEELARKVIAKYPEYQSRIDSEKSVGGFVGNVINSGARLVGDTVKAGINVFNPDMEKNTVANVVKLGADTVGGAMELATGGKIADSNKAKQLIDLYKQRYGKDLAKTLYEDPAGVLMDLSVLLTGGGAIAGKIGTATKIGKLAEVGETLAKTGAIMDPITAPGRIFSRTVGKVPGKLANTLEKTSDKLVTSGLGDPATQAKLAESYGQPVSKFIEKYDLYDRSPATASSVKRAIGEQYGSSIRNSSKKISVSDLVGEIDKEINGLTSGTNAYSDSNLSAAAELQRRKAQIIDLAKKNPHLSGSDLLDYRQALDKDIPRSSFALDTKQSGTAQGAKTTRDIVKSQIDTLDPNIAQMGKDYGMSKGVEKIFKRAETRSNNRLPFTLGNAVSSTAGGALAGVPGAVGALVLDKVKSAPLVLKTASKSASKASKILNGIDSIRTPKVVSNAYRMTKIAKTIDPSYLQEKQQEQQQVDPTQDPTVSGQTNQVTQSLPSPIIPKTPKVTGSMFSRPKIKKLKVY